MFWRFNLVLFLFLSICFSTSCQRYEGDECSTSQGAGECTLLPNCPTVYSQLLAGIQPEKLCGFNRYDPIICCPRDIGEITTTPQPTTTTEISITASIARSKCAKYSQAVYALEASPTLAGNRRPVNVSLCAVKSKKLIVGGTKADPREFPHMTAIGFNGRSNGILWLCGGSLVSDKYVLTAAHCTYSPSWGNAVVVRVGDLNLASSKDDARPQDRKIINLIRHPQYKRPSEYHDIALLKLESSVKFNAWVRPACLPVKPPERIQKAVASGWGKVDWNDDEGSNDLLKVTLNLVSQESCNSTYLSGSNDGKLKLGIVGNWQVCAGSFGKDTCQGDSGGPLAIFNEYHDCMYDVIGVTSLGRLCGSNAPGVYTRVYHYVPWLESVIWSE